MKKKLGIVSVLCVVLAMMFTLTGCNAQGSVKKNFENEGYVVSTVTVKDNDDAKNMLKTFLSEDEMKEAEKWEVLVVKDSLVGAVPIAAIIAFPSAGKLKETLTVEKEDGTKDTSAYDKAKESKVIRGNCWYFGVPTEKLLDIFNK